MNHLERYARQQLSQLRLHLRAFYDDNNEESLHQVRLCQKRMRAVARYVYLAGHPCDVMLGTLRKLRKELSSLGETRDYQVLLKFSTELQSDSAGHFRAKLEKEYMKSLKRLPARKKLEKVMMSAVEKLEEDGSLCFPASGDVQFVKVFQAQIDRIKQRYLTTGSEEDFHKLRRMLKEARYFLEFIPGDESVAIIPDETGTTLNELEQMLGHWHDMEILGAMARKLTQGEKNGGKTAGLLEEIHTLTVSSMTAFQKGFKNSGILELNIME